ncbi:hypothetical protein COCNU_16G000240 [Cocos nucifera]|uniref:Uncharacterized protein n=1 Tax=Cocos nucifera TaxID=13894 RepID=A0A8K0IXG4_COCNU|nr:hypothetical protein COCNU_16G000240 [Cocos nucifera]
MSSHPADLSIEVSPLAGAPSNSEAQDNRKGIGDYRVDQSLNQSILLLADIKAMDNEGLAHHLDHFKEAIQEARHISKEAKEKATQASRRADDAKLSKLKAEEKLKMEVERLESEFSKYDLMLKLD